MSELLRLLSDSELLSRTRDLAALERAVTLRLLLHLNEVERRQLHLAQGYSSMFTYCTSGLGYSEPAAFRRIRTARCVARFPQIFRLLEANRVNPTTIVRVSRFLTESNHGALLARISGRSLREVEAIVAEYDPVAKRRDVVRSESVQPPKELEEPRLISNSDDASRAPVAPAPPPVIADSQGLCEKSVYFRSEGDFHPTPAVERRVRFHFSTSEEFQRKLDTVKSLAWHRLPANASLEEVFELVLDAFIARNDPRARHARRVERKESKHKNSSRRTAREHIPAEIRDEVFARDGGRCAFVSSDGKRCDSTVGGLQVDHIVPVARGGASTPENLRLLCARHNRYEAKRLMPSG